ncbi:hypothetical protein QFC22_000167 [Naganishia vaughanmartiniae]|uniref:Uncharacterized protein n=1 Tax=Naganishia vaughanmartiniae TaxID=1424756 RepID=A0ACC2XMK3_9TREE|nr:hypothetical protein QFC22_000167 [Naganishia vaughanmartiniae]
MAPNGKSKKAATPSFEEVEAKRLDMVKSLTAVAEAMEAATTTLRAYLQTAPDALHEPEPETAAAGKKRKAEEKRKNKDPNAPKRPVTGYLAYSKDQMPILKQAHPDMPHQALVGLITERWKAMGDEEKKPYNDTFAAAMDDWRKETQEYKAHHDPAAIVAPAMAAASAVTAAAVSSGKVINPEADTATDAGTEDEESSTGSSSSSESEEEAEENEDKDATAKAPPAKRAKKEAAAPAPPAATPSKTQQKPKSTPAAAPVSSGKKSAATEKKSTKAKKTEVAAPAPASGEETPAKKRGRKAKA